MKRGSGPRRQMRRREVKRIRAAFMAGELKGKGCVSKISRKGLFFSTDKLPVPGQSVRVVFNDHNGKKITVEGIVRWNTAQLDPNSSGFGVEIVGAARAYLDFYDGMLTS